MSASLSTLFSSLTFAGRHTLMNILLGVSSYLTLRHFIFNSMPLNDLNQSLSFLSIKTNSMTDVEAWMTAHSSTIQSISIMTFSIALLFGTKGPRSTQQINSHSDFIHHTILLRRRSPMDYTDTICSKTSGRVLPRKYRIRRAR